MSTRVRAEDASSGHRSRKHTRIERTAEIQVRTTHRRRKVLTRMGVLAGFALAMVVYPVMGTITPYGNAAEALPDVQEGAIAPSTARAILGGGPQLLSSDLPLPSIDEQASAILTSGGAGSIVDSGECSGASTANGSNGRLALSSLCDLPFAAGQSLRGDAALSLIALNEHFKSSFGRDLCLSDSYRTLSRQYSLKASRGYFAAPPGTSMHGWAIAIDLCSSDSSGTARAWLDENAGIYGWANPRWAKGSKYEPWHWEFIAGTSAYYDVQE
ncbi:M15 family metallopeptidase [Demequina oxidasica]|uniref:M15 family metallopeptidase n=1 Tax=Demequina oxidasica TaxID=676199 RepID=UPI000A751EBE|nr:M15 family metallopeptidase [Demequina oxidasica]